MTSLPLGRLLVDTGVLTSSALDGVLEAQRGSGKRLGDLLVERGLVRPDQLAQLLSNQLGVPWVRLAHMQVEPDVVALVPREVAVAHHVLPVHVRTADGAPRLYVAADDPTDAVALEACARSARMPVKPMVALADDLRAAITRIYGAPPAPTRARTSLKPGEAPIEVLDDGDLVEVLAARTTRSRTTVLALNAPDKFLAACRAAVAALGADVIDGSLVRAAELALEHQPCAIVVTEDVYAFDREGLERLALDRDASLVAWNEDAEAAHLAPLLTNAILRAARASYEPGALVDGRYELLRELDCRVPRARWEVRHTRTARRALLEIGIGEAATSILAKQVALARVTHPGAPELRDGGTTQAGDPYLVLELVEGRSLDGLLAARGSVPAEDASAIAVQLGELLASAHAAGIAHRDVKLANVIVVRDPWGTERAKLVGWQNAAGASSREATAAREDVERDVKALASCVLELLAGKADPALAKLLASAAAGELDARSFTRALAHALPASSRSSLLEPVASGAAVPSRRPPGAEQRRFRRAPYRTPVRLEVPGFGSVDGRSEDISVGGLLVVARADVQPGTKLNVRFALPVDGRVVTEPATVKWARSAHKDAGLRAIGVELASVSPDTLAQVERYVGLMSDQG